MGGNFEEVESGLFSFSVAPIRIGVCKCTWMALTTITYGGYAFWAIVVLFQLIPPLRLSLHRFVYNTDREWLVQHSLLLGSELGVLAMVAFMTFLVPTLIMTWITALVFQYLFGRGLFGRSKGLVQEGSLIAKDITWMAIKSMLKRGNFAGLIVFIFALLVSTLNRKNANSETGKHYS